MRKIKNKKEGRNQSKTKKYITDTHREAKKKDRKEGRKKINFKKLFHSLLSHFRQFGITNKSVRGQ